MQRSRGCGQSRARDYVTTIEESWKLCGAGGKMPARWQPAYSPTLMAQWQGANICCAQGCTARPTNCPLSLSRTVALTPAMLQRLPWTPRKGSTASLT
jgi:hypothetical protein